jgi:hypothetical protein
MLGLLVFPREGFVKRIPKKSVDELEAEGWPIPRVIGEYEQVRDLRELVRYLRNAIAHFNIEFIGDMSNNIATVKVWNCYPGTERKTWEAELNLEELRGISERFIDILLTDGRQTP